MDATVQLTAMCRHRSLVLAALIPAIRRSRVSSSHWASFAGGGHGQPEIRLCKRALLTSVAVFSVEPNAPCSLHDQIAQTSRWLSQRPPVHTAEGHESGFRMKAPLVEAPPVEDSASPCSSTSATPRDSHVTTVPVGKSPSLATDCFAMLGSDVAARRERHSLGSGRIVGKRVARCDTMSWSVAPSYRASHSNLRT